ncbi:MAG: hypothetical protein A3G41_03595 [Elusimicrobia bacterium RIFCSPLOWO2_12_FULL_59_9]|nr:MAG: hypothetical protein A3G41_03595 [Elusimicrobia bacterium RIFCSPLOWO2_12_FULL_59_9]
MMRKFCALGLILGQLMRPCAVFAQAAVPDFGLLEQEQEFKRNTKNEIQTQIVDPILGKGQAQVFVDVEMEVKSRVAQEMREGMGVLESFKGKQGKATDKSYDPQYVLPGVPKPRFLTDTGVGPRPAATQGTQAQQKRSVNDQVLGVQTIIKRFEVSIIHDNAIPKAKLDLVRDRIISSYKKYKVQAAQIIFQSTQFQQRWWDLATDPGVFVPLIFAVLLFLLLLFLFGPFGSFLRSYVQTLRESSGTEVTVDSKIENAKEPGGAGAGGGGGGFFKEGKPEADEEEDEMENFKPFRYINADNLRQLAYLIRKEEPWIIAVVITYLAPEFARVILTSLPAELQSRVAIETATIRQLTREQVRAIDEQIKEKVNFVLGGVDHLTKMLEDVDENTRQNILEYLKNEKPALYEKVRESILTFEDFPSFPERVMQIFIRELSTEHMARALQQAPPEILNKFMANMSTGAASLLKEAMEYEKKLAPSQVEEERKKLLDVLKRLEKEGRIVVRNKKVSAVLEGLDEEVSVSEERSRLGAKVAKAALGSAQSAAEPGAANAASESELQNYFSAGIACYQQGQHEQSLAYFQHVVNFQPERWEAIQYLAGAYYALGQTQQALTCYERLLAIRPDAEIQKWVESLKQALSAS